MTSGEQCLNNRLPPIIAPFLCEKKNNNGLRLLFEENFGGQCQLIN